MRGRFSTMNVSVNHLAAQNDIISLAWSGNDLVDWCAGGTRYSLDGTIQHASVYYAYKFDAALASPGGRYAVIYERLGTKGLVLRDHRVVREINRSYYCAAAYAYPVAFAPLSDGHEAL